MNEKTLLSTKNLSRLQEEVLLRAGFSVESYDAIEIIDVDFEAPEFIENAIFTSQNGVRSFFENKTGSTRIKQCFCVGQKTELLLKKNGQNVVKTAKNASELAHFIINNHKNDSFSFICGSHRKEDIPKLLKQGKIPVFELKTYKTMLKPRHFDQKWGHILFFSPTGVESFIEGQKAGESAPNITANYFTNTTAICIGDTTATAAKKYTSNVIVAHSTTVGSVIDAAVKTIAHDKD
ncbi:MAG: uroporphyrinogen-III synthase [Bacteroidota bacterium]